MILEIATFSIKEDQAAGFIGAQVEAISFISKAKGFIGIQFKHCIENPEKHLAMISWETLEDHTVGFRESELFLKWRRVLSPFFASAPQVEHFS